MYKWLLCLRYLRTRYLAMACIVSVMLGVATLIVVNSVMGGFSRKLKDRLHGLLSDVVLESYDYNGFPQYQQKIEVIESDPYLKGKIKAVAPTLEIFAMLQFNYKGLTGAPLARPIRLIGVETDSRSKVGGFAEFLQLHKNAATFKLTPEGEARQKMLHRPQMGFALNPPDPVPDFVNGEKPPPEPPPSREFVPEGAIIGYALAHHRGKNSEGVEEEICMLQPGDDAIITTISSQKMQPVYARFAVADYFKSEMSEYDSNYVFVPLTYLQKLRTMEGRVTSIQILLKDEADSAAVVKRLKDLFGGSMQVLTWMDKQGPLLSAIAIEKGILNVLLFLIIAVAGFGILAIFSMIVVEKTRDIGILKALGASNVGVLKIFLGYGLLLGFVGVLLGTAFGVAITRNINQIEHFITLMTGQEVFDRKIYYFDSIPTDIQPVHIALINFGALAIAVLFSVLPALRAAMLHPVAALRSE